MLNSYCFLSGADNADFCQRVSDALADGYVLYGNPVIAMDKDVRVVGQAVILPEMIVTTTDFADQERSNDR
jgi:hypothetical protein